MYNSSLTSVWPYNVAWGADKKKSNDVVAVFILHAQLWLSMR